VLGHPVKPTIRGVRQEMRALGQSRPRSRMNSAASKIAAAQWRDEHVKMWTIARRFR
jgi:hypothetical protein